MSNDAKSKSVLIEPRATSVSSGGGGGEVSQTEVGSTVASQVSADFETATKEYSKPGNKTIQKRYATK
jgi:hypothetical protein